LDRKHEEADNRFYRSKQQQPEIYDADHLRRIMSISGQIIIGAITEAPTPGGEIQLSMRISF
jgi:hypothetical protein